MNANKIYFGLIDVWKIILKETILEKSLFNFLTDTVSVILQYKSIQYSLYNI